MRLLLKGIRLRSTRARFVRVDGSCSALGLELALRRGLGLGVGFKVQVKVNKNRSMRYLMGFMSCVGHACDPWPPQHQPHHLVATAPIPIRTRQPSPPPTLPDHTIGGGRGGWERQPPDHTCHSPPGPTHAECHSEGSVPSRCGWWPRAPARRISVLSS